MLKRFLIKPAAALAVMGMIFAVSCGNSKTAEPAGSVTAAAPGLSTGQDWFNGRTFPEHYDIEFASIQLDAALDYNNGDPWVQKWTRAFNVSWNVTPLTWENWTERLRIWINSDDAPDMFVLNYMHGEAKDYAEQGMVKRLPDNWKTRYPNLAKAYADSAMSAMAEREFGGTYYLFRPIFSTNRPSERISLHMSVYLRKDWGEAAGVDVKGVMKLSEFLDYARKVKAADPGKVGPAFAPIVMNSGMLALLIQFNSTYSGAYSSPYYLGPDGKYAWGPAAPETLEALKMLSQAYREGLIAREFYTLQTPDDQAAFYATGRSAAMMSEGMAVRMGDLNNEMRQNLGLNFDDVVEVVTIVGEDGHFHGVPSTNYWGAVAFSPHISDAKLDRILQMMDYSCTPYGQLEIRAGLEGIDWEYGGDGEIATLTEESIEQKYAIHSVYYNMLILSDDFQFQNPNYGKRYRDLSRDKYVLRDQLSSPESFPLEPDWNVTFHTSRAANLANLMYADEYAALIIKDGDIEANWRAWVNEKMPMIRPVLDELDANLKK
jgi:putative aldouronate transport system substrate-binding protein